MILNKRLINRAHQKVIYVETQAEKERFIDLVNHHKFKRTSEKLTVAEIAEIHEMYNTLNPTAMCYEKKWFKPVILFFSRNIRVGDAFWLHELVHYQLRRYRRNKGPQAGGLLLLKFLSMIPAHNLKIFFDVSCVRYGKEYLIDKYTDETNLQFLEEMFICAVADYNIKRVMKDDLEKVDTKDQTKYLHKVQNFLGQGPLKKLRTLSLDSKIFKWQLFFFRRRAMSVDKNLVPILDKAYRNPAARW